MPKREMPPIHPGEILLEEFIKPYKITPKKLSKNNVAKGYIQELIRKKEILLLPYRLAFYFQTRLVLIFE